MRRLGLGLGLDIVDWRLADGGGGRGKCPHVKMSSCKKGEGIVRDGEISGGNMSGGIYRGGNVLHPPCSTADVFDSFTKTALTALPYNLG